MTDLTPAQLAIARALVGDGWETDADIDDDARESITAAAHDVDAAARPLIEAEVRATIAAELITIAAEHAARAQHMREHGVPAADTALLLAMEAACAYERAAARIAEGGERRG